MPTIEKAVAHDAGLAAELRVGVMRLRRRLAVERHPDNELSLGAMTVLGCLHRFGDMTIGDLAAAERVQPPSMTRTVTALENGGYLQRRAHETDRRVVVVTLTEQGRATLLADRDRRDAWLARRLADLTEVDRQALRRAASLLQQLAQED